MAFVTTEDRVDRLEALFGQFMTEMAVLNHKADQRNKAAEERSRAADERMNRFETEMRAFKDEMGAFKDEMRVFKDEMRVFKDEMGVFKDEMGVFKDEMREFKVEMRVFKDEMRESKRELNKKWGDLANKLGTIIEDIVAPNLRRVAVEYFRFPVIEDFMIRRSRRHAGRETEFDALVVGPTAVILGEAKSSPSLEAAGEFAAKAALFFDFFPEYRGRRLIPVLGSWAIPDPVVERLTALGVYALRMGEDTMDLANAAILDSDRGADAPREGRCEGGAPRADTPGGPGGASGE